MSGTRASTTKGFFARGGGGEGGKREEAISWDFKTKPTILDARLSVTMSNLSR